MVDPEVNRTKHRQANRTTQYLTGPPLFHQKGTKPIWSCSGPVGYRYRQFSIKIPGCSRCTLGSAFAF